jgi:uncharacterized protein
MTPTLTPILQDLKVNLERMYGDRLVHTILFGSQARGDAQPGSDIDVLVVLKTMVNPGEEIARSGSMMADLSLQYDEVVSFFFMDEKHYQTHNGALLRNIQKEGIVL